ncbi:MAG: putative 4-hydroxybenzoate polyprenyltransferase [Phycisphaerales bacterium]|nr:putative 4-hydroxybenzoate polyprenyltransferase [Phycisphaerales bacterium]
MNNHDATTIPRNQTPEPDTASALGRFFVALGDIKLAHSVFALPFALLGAFLVAPHKDDAPHHGIDWSPFAGMLVLVVVCMVFARTWAMLVNRFVDRKIDADNPRTSRRAFASGALSTRDGVVMLSASALGFIAACTLFGVFFGNWWPTLLAIPVLIWIGFYSLTKRFTWLCHIFLGGALAASPVAAAIAVDPGLLAHTPAVFWIAGMVVCWVAGFDVIYALQDLDYDRTVGLSSIPARFGWKRAAWLSRSLHALAIVCLLFAWRSELRFGAMFLGAVVVVCVVLVYEHLVLARRGKAGIPMAFFTLNGVVSLVLGSAGCLDLVSL